MLLTAAAAQWKVPAAECRTEAAKVIHKSGKATRLRRAGAGGDEAGRAGRADAEADAKDFRILGKRTRRPGHAGQARWQRQYGIDAQLPACWWP